MRRWTKWDEQRDWRVDNKSPMIMNWLMSEDQRRFLKANKMPWSSAEKLNNELKMLVAAGRMGLKERSAKKVARIERSSWRHWRNRWLASPFLNHRKHGGDLDQHLHMCTRHPGRCAAFDGEFKMEGLSTAIMYLLGSKTVRSDPKQTWPTIRKTSKTSKQ